MDRLNHIPGAKFLRDTRIVAIARNIVQASSMDLTGALYRGGIRVLEVTLNTAGATEMIETLRKKYLDTMWIGAGTVLTISQAQAALGAGAQFFVTPNVDFKVIDFAVSQNVPIFCGAMTPSEIVNAYDAGSTAVKVFPSRTMGPNYFRELRGPLPHIPLMAVGGISADNAAGFLDAGAFALGVGGSLVDLKRIQAGKFDEIEALSRELVSAAGRV